jgi:hypothetical protein
LEPIKEYVKAEEVFPVDGQDRIILATMYKIKPSKLNGRQRFLIIHEDVTEKREMERRLERKRKMIEKMDELTKTLMAFYELSPLHMASVCIREDDIELRLLNPAKLNWLEKIIPDIRKTYSKKGWLRGSKCSFNATCIIICINLGDIGLTDQEIEMWKDLLKQSEEKPSFYEKKVNLGSCYFSGCTMKVEILHWYVKSIHRYRYTTDSLDV